MVYASQAIFRTRFLVEVVFIQHLCMWAIAKDEEETMYVLYVLHTRDVLIHRFIFVQDEFLRKPEYALMIFL